MAKSSTSFGPGNKLAVRHGANDPGLVALRAPAIRKQIYADLEGQGYLTQPDNPLVERYVYLNTQAQMREEWFEAVGGMFFPSGAPRPGYMAYIQLVNSIEKFAKILAQGPHPRAQMAQLVAGAGKDVALIRAAQERARARLQEQN